MPPNILRQLLQNEAVLVPCIIFAIFFVIWIISREFRCWYWKTNRVISLLENNDAKLESIDTKLGRIATNFVISNTQSEEIRKLQNEMRKIQTEDKS